MGALGACVATACTTSSHRAASPSVARDTFGTLPDGRPVTRYTLTNGHGMRARLVDYGATLTELWTPDRDGRLANVVLGYDSLAPYLANRYFLGATMGRVANRIANGQFTLDGRAYALATNNGPNHLHGGVQGFDKRLWRGEVVSDSAVALHYTSPDGEEGYPGTLNVTMTVTLQADDALRLDYAATTSQATPVNLTNHTFVNLAGAGTVLGHVLTVTADRWVPVNATLIPTGGTAPVAGTPFDFTTPRRVGERITPEGGMPNGYDNTLVLRETARHPGGSRDLPDVPRPERRGEIPAVTLREAKGAGMTSLAARVTEPTSGRVMELWTTEPAMQLFTGNRFDGSATGVGGLVFVKHAGLALETEHVPDSVNHPEFPSTILRPGTTFRSTTVYRFTAERRP